MKIPQKEFYSVSEVAEKANISRQAVLKKIKNGQISANKVGNNYIISRDVVDDSLTEGLKREIEIGVNKVVDEYGDVLKKLGKE